MKPRSLRTLLLAWLLVPLAASVAINTWITRQGAVQSATEVQDRLLLGSARIIAQQTRVEEGSVQVVIPPAALELFQSNRASDRVYYKLAAPDGELLSGYLELPSPPVIPAPEEAEFYMSDMRGQAVRVVVFTQPVIGAGPQGTVVIQVAQTMAGHAAMVREIYLGELAQQMLLLLLVGVLVWLALRRGLAPLNRLSKALTERMPGSHEPLVHANVPDELQPLVDSINEYIERLRRYQSDRERFVANAAHQLRTPLAILHTQASVALRTQDTQMREDALLAIDRGIQSGKRLVNQLLSLSSAETTVRGSDESDVDLTILVSRVLEEYASAAHARHMDLGIECDDGSHSVRGSERLVHELISNLVDNAIRYGRTEGTITVRIQSRDDQTVLSVIDDGPGISEADRERVFERFVRLDNGDSDGCGLGLAIVREIADVSGASVRLASRENGPGLEVTVVFSR